MVPVFWRNLLGPSSGQKRRCRPKVHPKSLQPPTKLHRMTSQKKALILITYPLYTGMYLQTAVFWNVKPCSLMDSFLWNRDTCYIPEEHNINILCCEGLESHKHMFLSHLSNVHNPHFDIQGYSQVPDTFHKIFTLEWRNRLQHVIQK
jgi:hypothetical protein